MSKSVRMVIGIAAAIVMPYAAPALAGMIGLSGAVTGALGVSAATGGAIAGGLTGAALGAASSAALGGDIGKGALFGALGGGLGGYASAAKAAQAGAAGGAASGTGSGAAGAATTAAAPAAAAPVGTGTVLAPEAAGVSSGMAGTAGAGAGYTPAAGMGIMPNAPAQTAGLSNLGSAGAAGGYSIGGTNITVPTAYTPAAAPSLGQRFVTGMKNTWDAATTPENLAEAATTVGKNLAGAALAGSGMTSAEEAMLKEQRRELRRAQDANAAAYETRRGEALKLINEANYYDPEYTGLQSARDAQLRGARAKQAGLRGLTGGDRQAESRRFDLGTNRATGAAYDQGYQRGITARTATRTAGINALPTGYDMTTSDYGSIASQMGDYEERRRQNAEDIGTLFGDFSGSKNAKKTG